MKLQILEHTNRRIGRLLELLPQEYLKKATHIRRITLPEFDAYIGTKSKEISVIFFSGYKYIATIHIGRKKLQCS